jgi:hypothetical protein
VAEQGFSEKADIFLDEIDFELIDENQCMVLAVSVQYQNKEKFCPIIKPT